MEIDVTRTAYNTFAPIGEDNYEDCKKFPLGEVFRCKIWKPRNYKYHQKFFALIAVLFDMQDHFENKKALRYWLTMKAGFFSMVVAPNGSPMYFAESISFSKMDNVKFEKLFNGVIDVALKEICKGSNKESIESQVNTIIGFS